LDLLAELTGHLLQLRQLLGGLPFLLLQLRKELGVLGL
jgi:hypothetical protein